MHPFPLALQPVFSTLVEFLSAADAQSVCCINKHVWHSSRHAHGVHQSGLALLMPCQRGRHLPVCRTDPKTWANALNAAWICPVDTAATAATVSITRVPRFGVFWQHFNTYIAEREEEREADGEYVRNILRGVSP